MTALQVGDKVLCNGGYRGTVILRYDEGIVEVRLARGVVAVSDSECLSITEAIRARQDGEWDNPHLLAFGPLSESEEKDIAFIEDSGKHGPFMALPRELYTQLRGGWYDNHTKSTPNNGQTTR